MEAYKIEQLNKSYADKVIFDDLNLSISEHEKIGLVGINGTCLLYTSPSPRDQRGHMKKL